MTGGLLQTKARKYLSDRTIENIVEGVIMDYPRCNLKCNGMLNCHQLEHLLETMEDQDGRQGTIDFYEAMLKKNFARCPLKNNLCKQQAASMF